MIVKEELGWYTPLLCAGGKDGKSILTVSSAKGSARSMSGMSEPSGLTVEDKCCCWSSDDCGGGVLLQHKYGGKDIEILIRQLLSRWITSMIRTKAMVIDRSREKKSNLT